MPGIDKQKAEGYLSRNEEMYNRYLNGATLEQIGDEYSLTKQRVWQIIRRCKLGDGDYYEAPVREREKKQEIEELDLSADEATAHISGWLQSKGVKQIRRKVEGERVLATGEKEST